MNDNKAKQPLSTKPYKGVRDFFPEDMFVQNHIFDVMRKTVEKFGYAEYNASILEPTELYRSKTSEEIVNEQTYNFIDRSERDVTLRPEMTPTVARMIAAKRRDLAFPVRWYSIPNVFRYEQPQRGRLREHWQLNVDLFGSTSIEADAEIITIAHNIMKAFGAKDEDFVIKVNNRESIRSAIDTDLNEDETRKFLSFVDKRQKIGEDKFKEEVVKTFGKAVDYNVLGPDTQTEELITALKNRGISNIEFDACMVRGFDYYTGTVFEIFDTNLENKRSLLGGGRYDNLTTNFGGDAIPGIGFGMGDVTIHDFLETRKLLPAYRSKTDIFIATIGEVFSAAQELADRLRKENINVAVNISNKKIGDQIKLADKQTIPYILVVGEDEIKNQTFTIKELTTGTETRCSSIAEIAQIVRS